MAPRPKHQDKDVEKVLKQAEAEGWRVWKDNRYFKMYCPCPRKCKKFVACTPSGSRFLINLIHKLRSATCWKGEIK